MKKAILTVAAIFAAFLIFKLGAAYGVHHAMCDSEISIDGARIVVILDGHAWEHFAE